MDFLKNEDTDVTNDSLDGLKSAYPGLQIHSSKGIVLLNRERSHRVALLSGGGAGHEPFGAGFVGENMLTGFVYGPIFDSPPIGSVTTAIQHLANWNQGGIIVFILNAPSNRMSFGLAVERAKTKGIKIQSVYITDDCSLVGINEVQHQNLSERKTLTGAVMIFKILGGLASSGADMEQILWEFRLLSSMTASLSIVYGACRLPGKIKPQFHMKKYHISLGTGPNGEEGGIYTFRNRPIEEVVEIAVDKLLPRCLIYGEGSVCVLVNGLGTLTEQDTYILASEVNRALVSRNVEVIRMFVGKMLTALDSRGFHITLTNVKEKDLWVKLLDLETEAFAWPGTKLSRVHPDWPKREFTMDIQDIAEVIFQGDILPLILRSLRRNSENAGGMSGETSKQIIITRSNSEDLKTLNAMDRISGKELDCFEASILKNCIQGVCKVLMIHKDELNNLCRGTSVVLGTEMNKFAERTLLELRRSSAFLMSLPNTFLKLSKLAEETMDTSAAGSIYGLLFIGAAKSASRPWHEIWKSAVALLSKYSSARTGHRSLFDSLIPACNVFERIIARDGPESWKNALRLAIEAAEFGCAETSTMISMSIKSPFYGENQGEIEAGARAVVLILQTIYNELNDTNLSSPAAMKNYKSVTGNSCRKMECKISG